MEQFGPSRARQELRFELYTSLHLACGPQAISCDPQVQIWKFQTLQGLFLSRFVIYKPTFSRSWRVRRLDLTEEKRTWPLLGASLHGFRERPRREDHLQGQICWFWVFGSFHYELVLLSSFLVVCCHVWVVYCILGLGNILFVMDVDYNWYLVVVFILDWFYSHLFLLKLVYCLVSPWIKPNSVWHELSNDLQLIRDFLGWFIIWKYPRGTFRV